MSWFRSFQNFGKGAILAAPQGTENILSGIERRRERQDEQDSKSYQAALQTGDVDTMNRLQQGNKRLGRQFSNFSASATVAASDEERQATEDLATLQQQYTTATSEEQIAALQQREAQIRSKMSQAQRRVGRLKPGQQFAPAPESGYKAAAQRVSARGASLQVAAESIKAIDSGAKGIDPYQVAKDIMSLQHPELDPAQLDAYSRSLGASFEGRLKSAEQNARNASIAASMASIKASEASETREQRKEFLMTSYMMDPARAEKIGVGLGFRPGAAQFFTMNRELLADPNPAVVEGMKQQWRQIAKLNPDQDDEVTRSLDSKAALNATELKMSALQYGYQQALKGAPDFDTDPNKVRAYRQQALNDYMEGLDQLVKKRVTGGASDEETTRASQLQQAANNPPVLRQLVSAIQNSQTLSSDQKKRLLDQVQQMPAAEELSLPFMNRLGSAMSFGVGAVTGGGSIPAAGAALKGMGNVAGQVGQLVKGAAGGQP